MTIKDIAAKCGVSVATVSRVINNQPYVKDEVREQVLKVIEEEHFVPHAGAVSLVKNREKAVGLVIRGRENVFLGEMVPMIESAVSLRGYSFSMIQISSNEDELVAAAQFVKTERLQGIILLGGRADYTPDEIRMLDVPFVCCTFTNTAGTLDVNSYSSVTIDDEAVAKRVTEYLIDLGHTRIALLGARLDEHSIGKLRFDGYCKALDEHGIEHDPALTLLTGNFRMDSAYEWTRELIERKVPFSAIFAISDAQAVAAMKALYDSGLRVPEDCSVIGIDGLELTRYYIPALTTMVQPKEIMATKASSILIDLIEGRTDPVQVFVAPTMRDGESVAAPKAT